MTVSVTLTTGGDGVMLAGCWRGMRLERAGAARRRRVGMRIFGLGIWCG
jgi:hypothetical protein